MWKPNQVVPEHKPRAKAVWILLLLTTVAYFDFGAQTPVYGYHRSSPPPSRKPNQVVPEHKPRAKAVWIVLLLTTVAYTVWQIWDVAEQYKSPSTTLSISNDPYNYPEVHMCFLAGYGCTDDDVVSRNCVDTALSLVYYNGEGTDIDHTISEDYPECITFDLSSLPVDAETDSTLEESPYISVVWTASTSPGDNTSYIEMIGVVLGDFNAYELTYIPYTRVEFPATTDEIPEEMSVMMIQKTHRTYLSQDAEDMFAIWSIATAATDPFEITDDYDQDTERAEGQILLKIEQAPYSLVGISDDEPLSVGSLLGNIEASGLCCLHLLLVAWAVFFVSMKKDSEPEFKARNLGKSIKKGREAVGKRLGRSTTAATPQTAETEAEARPDWEAPYRAAFATRDGVGEDSSAGGVGTGDLPDGSQKSRQPSLSASFWRRPVELANPSRGGGGSPPPV